MRRYHSGRLTSTDASFLYFEREDAPMHIGALCLIEGELPHEEYVARVTAKLPKLPRFRERIVFAPFWAGHPTWETDPDFEVAEHMPLHQLEPPGTMEQLFAKVNELIEGMMDRSRPLWEFHTIQGLENGNTAVVSKVHHSMVDGVGGNAILTTLFDLQPHPPEERIEDDYVATAEPPPGRRLADALWDGARTQIDVWSDHFRRLTEIGQQLDRERLESGLAALADGVPDLLRPPKRLPFNQKCGGRRSLEVTQLSFAEARAIRSALGGTVNDVMLTALGGAVGRYCEEHGQSTEKLAMRVMVPVNVRPDTKAADLGNLVSVLPVRVPLDLPDHEQRLHAVRAGTRILKEGRVAESVSLMSNLAGAVPAPLQAAFGAIATSPFPPFNLVCTNVPGPQIPLYALGHRLLEYYPHVPVGFNMGVNCAIFSYDQRLFIGLNSDTEACPDAALLRRLLDETFAEMKQIAGIGDIAPVELAARRGPPATAEGAGRPKPKKKKTGTAKRAKKQRTEKKASKRPTAKKRPR